MTNSEVSRLLNNVAAAYSIKDEKKYRFQILAYQKAADAIEHSPHEIKELYKENKLNTIPGVGPSIQAHLAELFTTGKVKHFDEVLSFIPQAVYPLLDIPSFGPKKAYRLVTAFGLKNPENVINELETIAKAGKIAPLTGFGEKSQQDIIQAIEEYRLGKTKTARMVLPYANELANKMLEYLKQCPHTLHVYPLGSLRRKRETVGDIDIAVATNNPEAVLDYFTAYPYTERVIERGTKTSSILVSSGRQIDLMVQAPEGFGALLQHFTGSKAHNVHLREYALSKDLSVSDYGIRPKGSDGPYTQIKTEEDFYGRLGLQWVPPEMRENTGEIELALENKLPKLLELRDIKGDFHIHSSYPIEPSHDMGQNSMEEMIEHAIQLGYEYLAFSEHNPSVSKHSPQEVCRILEKRGKFIEQIGDRYKKDVRVFSLLETDILTDGSLAIDGHALDFLDATLVSIHSGFDMERERMTERILKGLSHPKAKILSHPTGRLLNQRSGYEIDWDMLFDFCMKHNKALEINASPLRLDLQDTMVREAVKRGIKMSIDTDSHATIQMDLMEYGVSVARRGWATKHDILNAMPYNEVEAWLRK